MPVSVDGSFLVSVRAAVLLWAQRLIARRDASPHQLLEIDADAGLPAAQEAFHKIARIAHPDLHRGSLTDEDLALVVAAYARVSAAYQTLRRQTEQSGSMPLLPPDPPLPRARTSSGLPLGARTRAPTAQPPQRAGAPSTQPFPQRPASPSTPPASRRAPSSPGIRAASSPGIRAPTGTQPDARAPGAHLAAGSSPDAIKTNTPGGISPKALVHYRRAELSLRRGELREAVLQLKLAVASDPQSAFLRTALAEVEAVVGK